MPVKLEVVNVKQVKDQLRSLMFEDARGRRMVRLHTVLLVCHGLPVQRIAEVYDISPTTVRRWVHRWNRLGVEGMADLPGRGRRPVLSRAERRRLARDLSRPPTMLGYSGSKWSGRLLARHLRRHFGAELKVRQCQNLLQRFAAGDWR